MTALGYLFVGLIWWAIVWIYVYCLARGAHQTRPAGQAWRVLARVHQEMWPPAGVGIVLTFITGMVHLIVGSGWDRPGGLLLMIFVPVVYRMWVRAKDWPDNIWKRRLRKSRDRVVSVGHRLAVEPS